MMEFRAMFHVSNVLMARLNMISRQCPRMIENEDLIRDEFVDDLFCRIEFHGSKLFTQKGSGYFHVFNASICGKTPVTCMKTPVRMLHSQ